MKQIYLVVVASSYPDDGHFYPYTTKEEAVKHFESLLEEDFETIKGLEDFYVEQLLEQDDCKNLEEWKEKVRKDLKFCFDSGQHIWMTAVQTKKIKEKYEEGK